MARLRPSSVAGPASCVSAAKRSLVVAAVTHRGRSVVARAAVVVVLAVLQPLFAGLGTDTNPWWGVLHALDAVVIAGLTGSLIGSGMRASPAP